MSLVPIEYKNQRIMTTRILAEQYGATEKNINDNFCNNRERFKEGKHFIKLEGKELKIFKNSLPDNIGQPLKFAPKLILWTERGAARHAKILETDEAWEVYEVLEDTYFKVREVKQLSPMEQLRLQYKALEEQGEEISVVKNEVRELKDNMPLFNIDCEELQKEVKKKAVKCLGGFDNEAYHDKSLRAKVFGDIQREIKRQFDVNSYKAIRRSQLDIAIEIVKKYEIPFALKEQIEVVNSQISIGV